jgi:hypothetical protein
MTSTLRTWGVFGTISQTLLHKLHRGAAPKKLEFVECLFSCSYNFTFFSRTECVKLKLFS